MGFTFKLGSKLILQDGLNTYEVKVSDVEFSETFIESGYSVATLHNNPAINQKSIVNEKSNCTFSFTMFISDDSTVEKKILSWYGFDVYDPTDTCFLPSTTADLSKNQFEVYLDLNGALKVNITECVLENMSFQLNPRGTLGIQITGSGMTSIMQGVTIPTLGTTYSQTTFTNQPLEVEVGGSDIYNIRGVTVEFTKNVTWLKNKTVHEALSPTMYIPDYAYSSGMSVSGTVTRNKVTDSEPAFTEDTSIMIRCGSAMSIWLPSCNITERTSVGSIITSQEDFKALTAQAGYVKF